MSDDEKLLYLFYINFYEHKFYIISVVFTYRNLSYT